MRDKTDKATEEWEKLNFDIHTLRYAKREVRSRWKKILEQLGYQNEVDVLLLLNKQRRFSRDQEHFKKATELLTHLLNHTSLFPPGTGPQNRYLSTMVLQYFILRRVLFMIFLCHHFCLYSNNLIYSFLTSGLFFPLLSCVVLSGLPGVTGQW
uniref:Melanoregulin n=1 Tax=Cynoglossus semilaevis TaxID=244447 RepID=A0A3P8WV43_CYNSE